MNSTITEETTASRATAADEPPKSLRKATCARRRAAVAHANGKAGKKAQAAKKAPQGTKKAARAAKAKESRKGSKTATILELLNRPGGATAKELMGATGWQPHSLRGFLSGTLRKKLSLEVLSAKSEDGERTYSIKP
jgi:Protein of unknown function (DUF3489)